MDKGVKDVSGKPMSFWEQRNQLDIIWKALEELEVQGKGFYEWIDQMPDAGALWSFSQNLNPIVLTGIPRGTWAPPQKRNWVKEHFGSHVPVITCPSYQKHQFAMDYLKQDNLNDCVLVDDRISAAKKWEQYGGTFVHHTSAIKSIQELQTIAG